ncbi:MAG: TMEM175 family protein [Panacibacter sp.]
MNKNRLEAFSDGVLAIIITIMVLEIKVPHGADWNSLKPLIPVFLSYIISFQLIGIYWGNHHHLLHAVKYISSGIMLSNLHLLFWLSMVPFATGWMGENHFAPNTIILYAITILFCGIAYSILQNNILKTMDKESSIVVAIRKQYKKVILSVAAATAAIPFAYVSPVISGLLFFIQSAIWLIPDKNIERALRN